MIYSSGCFDPPFQPSFGNCTSASTMMYSFLSHWAETLYLSTADALLALLVVHIYHFLALWPDINSLYGRDLE